MANKQYKCLVVEDDFNTRDLVIQVLQEDCPYLNVFGSENGKDALELVNKNKFDVCVTDGRMPLMDGFVFVTHMRKLSPDTGIVFVTSCSSEFKKADAFCLGVDEFLEKPFEIEHLKDAIIRALRKRVPDINDTINNS